MRISDWSSDVCSSELGVAVELQQVLVVAELGERLHHLAFQPLHQLQGDVEEVAGAAGRVEHAGGAELAVEVLRLLHRRLAVAGLQVLRDRSEEHTSELQSLMRISYAVFCLKKKKQKKPTKQ